jgi:prepilin-type N-terminal cleavage/methylation domain-containing protein
MRRASQHAKHVGAACDAGFSLLELMMVLAILAGVVALSFPRIGLGRLPPRSAVQSMALQVATDLRATRAEAMRTNSEQTFTLALGQRATWSQAQPTPRHFVEGIDVDVTGPDLAWSGLERSSDRAVQVRFQPTGAATGGEIIVRDSRQAAPHHVARISIDWLTGVARIEPAR